MSAPASQRRTPLRARPWGALLTLAVCLSFPGCLLGTQQHPRRTESVDAPPDPAPGSGQTVLEGAPPAEQQVPEPPPACAGAVQVPAGWAFTGTDYRWRPATWRCPEAWER